MCCTFILRAVSNICTYNAWEDLHFKCHSRELNVSFSTISHYYEIGQLNESYVSTIVEQIFPFSTHYRRTTFGFKIEFSLTIRTHNSKIEFSIEFITSTWFCLYLLCHKFPKNLIIIAVFNLLLYRNLTMHLSICQMVSQ